MYKITLKEMFQMESDLGEISTNMVVSAREEIGVWQTIMLISAIFGSVFLCLSTGLLCAGAMPGFVGCFTAVIICAVAFKMSANRLRYLETVIVTYYQSKQLASFKNLME